MKKIFVLLMIGAFALTATACFKSIEDILKDALEEIVVHYQEGDSAAHVTKDLILPTSSNNSDVEVIWTSSNNNIVSSDGNVTRPLDANVSVTLTVTVLVGDEELSFNYTITVIKGSETDNALNALLDTLVITYVSGDDSHSVTENITLPTTTSNTNVTVTWTSNNTSVISNTGVVTRPTTNDVNVTLTATVTLEGVSNSKGFVLTVLKVVDDDVTITDAKLLPAGSDVTVTGIVVSFFNFTEYVIQDEENGILLIDEDSLYYEDLDFAYTVVVEGSITTRYGVNCIIIDTLTYTRTDADYLYYEITSLESQELDEMLWYSADISNISLSNLIDSTIFIDTLYLEVQDSFGNTANLYLDIEGSWGEEILDFLGTLSTDDMFKIYDTVVFEYNNEYFIHVLEAGQIEVLE